MSRRVSRSFLLAALLLAFAPLPADAGTCGNGRLNHGEGCDDGNLTAGDGCAPNCLNEIGWACSRDNPSVCTNQDVCGNGEVETGEACDDGNLTFGDGCTPDCTVQDGHTCTGEPSVCVPPGSLPENDCGNGVVHDDEECDDGNLDDEDGCEDCMVSSGFECTGEPSVCSSTTGDCGDGSIDIGEECDDADTASGDGCESDCTRQDGFLCTGQPSVCSSTTGDCGNGSIDIGEECDDADTTSSDGCDSECMIEGGFECTGVPSVCSESDCGNGTVDAGEDCDGGPCCVECSFATSSRTCRVAAGGCDAPETCSGSSASCGTDLRRPSTFVCRADAGVCDLGQETCSGTSNACPADAVAGPGTTCRAAAGSCDLAETCNGTSGSCPSDARSTALCRAAAGGCDTAEFCNGSSVDCPADSLHASNSVCRASTGVCDAVERCNGISGVCPTDVLSTSTTVCRPAVSDACDVAETCTGASGECPEDELVGCPDSDDADCVNPACDPSGECTTIDECVEVCREPRFWATRATNGKDRQTAIDLVLDQSGTIEVCGQSIDNADDLGELDAALEGLCVSTRGIEERDLYRALLATALNCLVSEGGDCDDILSRFVEVSFSDCDAICQGEPVPGGPSIQECIDELECFNSGGQIIEGECATGTCASDSELLCGGDFGSCPGDDAESSSDMKKGAAGDTDDDDGDTEDECVGFENNCADAKLCQPSDAEARLCGRKLVPRNNKVCKEARNNQCTIDSCD